MMFYQVLTRKKQNASCRDSLVLIYNTNGAVVRCFEFSRSVCSADISSLYPNTVLNQLESIHLQPSEYNRLKKNYSDILETL